MSSRGVAQRPHAALIQPRRRTDWMDRMACRDTNIDFISDNITEIAQAKGFCWARCPVRLDCLEYALAGGERSGVWGGLTPEERRNVQRQRQRKGLR